MKFIENKESETELMSVSRLVKTNYLQIGPIMTIIENSKIVATMLCIYKKAPSVAKKKQ